MSKPAGLAASPRANHRKPPEEPTVSGPADAADPTPVKPPESPEEALPTLLSPLICGDSVSWVPRQHFGADLRRGRNAVSVSRSPIVRPLSGLGGCPSRLAVGRTTGARCGGTSLAVGEA